MSAHWALICLPKKSNDQNNKVSFKVDFAGEPQALGAPYQLSSFYQFKGTDLGTSERKELVT